MFKITVYGLWSTDFLKALSKVIAGGLNIERNQAKVRLEGVSEGQPLVFQIEKMKEARILAEELMECGAYLSVDQIAPFSEEQMKAEILEELSPDLTGWMVVLDKTETEVRKLIDPRYLAKIRFVSPQVTDQVGEEMMWRGASPISAEIEAQIEAKMKAWRKAWGQRIRAAIARKIALRKQNQSLPPSKH